MSKDKGTKNTKKAPMDKSLGKGKIVSDYKAEGKSGQNKQPALAPFVPKLDTKTGGIHKS